MATYIYSKWINSTQEYPIEFYSELDAFRNETRKVEVFRNGKLGYASKSISKFGTKLGIIPVPSMMEIKMQHEFNTKEICKEEFEDIWKKATAKEQK